MGISLRNKLIMAISFIVLSLMGCSESDSNNSAADWAYSFVVWDGYIYELSDEYVKVVEEEIGEVTSYSNSEGDYTGNFSNEYKTGSMLPLRESPSMETTVSEKSGPAEWFHVPNWTILTVLPQVDSKRRPNAPANQRL